MGFKCPCLPLWGPDSKPGELPGPSPKGSNCQIVSSGDLQRNFFSFVFDKVSNIALG